MRIEVNAHVTLPTVMANVLVDRFNLKISGNKIEIGSADYEVLETIMTEWIVSQLSNGAVTGAPKTSANKKRNKRKSQNSGQARYASEAQKAETNSTAESDQTPSYRSSQEPMASAQALGVPNDAGAPLVAPQPAAVSIAQDASAPVGQIPMGGTDMRSFNDVAAVIQQVLQSMPNQQPVAPTAAAPVQSQVVVQQPVQQPVQQSVQQPVVDTSSDVVQEKAQLSRSQKLNKLSRMFK